MSCRNIGRVGEQPTTQNDRNIVQSTNLGSFQLIGFPYPAVRSKKTTRLAAVATLIEQAICPFFEPPWSRTVRTPRALAVRIRFHKGIIDVPIVKLWGIRKFYLRYPSSLASNNREPSRVPSSGRRPSSPLSDHNRLDAGRKDPFHDPFGELFAGI